MSQGRANLAVEGSNEDRISALPGNVIDHILDLLPAQDAAKTCILSKNWRYTWRKLPYLVLDYRFHELRGMSRSFFIQVVDSILSLHLGDIVKFVLYIIEQEGSQYDVYRRPEVEETLNEDVDRWMRHVTRDGIKELTLFFPENIYLHVDESIYKVPSCVFGCTTLTRLELCRCVFKPPNSSLDFPKLETLYLEMVNIVPTTEFCLLNVPLLFNLILSGCYGTQYLHIISPLLEVLCADRVHYLMLNYFMNCKKLRELQLDLFYMADSTNPDDEGSTVGKFLFSLAPTLEKLDLTSSVLELLHAGTIPRGPLIMLNCLREISSYVEFGGFSQTFSETSGLLKLITGVPNLSKLEIFSKIEVTIVGDTVAVEKYKKYLNSPACSDQSINKLKHIVMHKFRGTEIELLFIKLLLARTPSLVKMTFEDAISRNERSVPRELMSCPRASPNAELYYFPR